MDLELEDKVIIITGGAKGIGLGITRAFAAEGSIPVILGRNESEAKVIVDEITASGQRADSIHAELTSEEDIKRAVAEILLKYGRIDVLVNNAGGNDAVGLRATPQEFISSLERNIVHVFTLVHYALDSLITTRGNIINIGSKTAVTGQGKTSGYAASKGAMNALTREWALSLAQYGIRSNCVVPAEVMTPAYERWLENTPDPARARDELDQTVPLGRRTTTVEEIADTVVFIASSRSSHTTGQILYPDGGYVHLDRACTAEISHIETSP